MADHAAHVQACLEAGDRLSALIGDFALSRGAVQAEADKAKNIAGRVLPALLWKLDTGELRSDAASLSEDALLGGFGVAVSVLNRSDMPLALRSALFPILRPDAREVSVDWWDEVAVPRWFSPFLAGLESAGAIANLVTTR